MQHGTCEQDLRETHAPGFRPFDRLHPEVVIQYSGYPGVASPDPRYAQYI